MTIEDILKRNNVENYQIKHRGDMELLLDVYFSEKTVHLILSECDLYECFTIDVLCDTSLKEDEEILLKKLTTEIVPPFFKNIRMLGITGNENMRLYNAMTREFVK